MIYIVIKFVGDPVGVVSMGRWSSWTGGLQGMFDCACHKKTRQMLFRGDLSDEAVDYKTKYMTEKAVYSPNKNRLSLQ